MSTLKYMDGECIVNNTISNDSHDVSLHEHFPLQSVPYLSVTLKHMIFLQAIMALVSSWALTTVLILDEHCCQTVHSTPSF